MTIAADPGETVHGARMIPSSLKVLNALSVLAASPEPIGLSDVAAKLDVPRPTAHRLLTALVDDGWARTVGKPRRYAPSLKTIELGFAAARNNRNRTLLLNVLADLAPRVVPYTALLVFYEGGDVIITDAVESRAGRTSYRVVGSRFPAATSSSGRMYLAYQDEAEIEVALRRPYSRRTDFTKTGREEILSEIALARQHGYCIADRELDPASTSISVPVFSGGKVAAIISLSALPAGAPPEMLARVLPPLFDAAATGASELGTNLVS